MGGRGRGKKMEVRRVGGRVVFAGTDLHRYSLADQFHLGILSRVQKKKKKKKDREKKKKKEFPTQSPVQSNLIFFFFFLSHFKALFV